MAPRGLSVRQERSAVVAAGLFAYPGRSRSRCSPGGRRLRLALPPGEQRRSIHMGKSQKHVSEQKRNATELRKFAQALTQMRAPHQRELDKLRAFAAAQKELNEAVDRYVVLARESGHSWPEIGASLGISPQGAQYRFDKEVTRRLVRTEDPK